MKYRAKITHIESLVKENLNVKNCFICHDSTDTYIEVDTEDEAILLEHANNLVRKLQNSNSEKS